VLSPAEAELARQVFAKLKAARCERLLSRPDEGVRAYADI